MGQASLVIGDTSPLFYLYRIGQLDLLHRLFDEVCVPPAVEAELRAGIKDGAPDVKQIPWVKIKTPKHSIKKSIFDNFLDLGEGEREVLTLALSHQLATYKQRMPPSVVALLDDKAARQLAHAFAIPVQGTLGTLLEAKNRGLIPRVRPLVEKLRETTNMYLNDELVQRICRLAGE